jgi:uncharacterized protein YjbJ (UPF0337 family)
MFMNWQTVEGNWMQFRGTVRARWNKLTGEHLDSIAGNREQLLGKLQELYGINKVDANKEIKAFEERNKDYRGK